MHGFAHAMQAGDSGSQLPGLSLHMHELFGTCVYAERRAERSTEGAKVVWQGLSRLITLDESCY